jgi:hypothetical protein
MKKAPHQQPWIATADIEVQMRSALAACRFAVASPDLMRGQRRHIIDGSIWLVTEEAPSRKYQTRYRSSGALVAHKDLRHDHVWTRKGAVDAILKDPDCIEKVLRQAIGCTVTKDEHARLNRVAKNLDGWDRYLEARIDVMDMLTEEPFIANGAYVTKKA